MKFVSFTEPNGGTVRINPDQVISIHDALHGEEAPGAQSVNQPDQWLPGCKGKRCRRRKEVEVTLMPEIENRLVGHLKAKGYDKESSKRIARSSLQRDGILKKGSDELTPRGKKHNAAGPKGRAAMRKKGKKW